MASELNECPVCNSSDFQPFFSGKCTRKADGKEWPVVLCSCGHAFMNPRPSRDELAYYYDDTYDPYEADHGLSQQEIENARESGEFRHIKIVPGMKVLDVGCGGGAFLRTIRELGADVFGVEPSSFGVKSARNAGVPVFHGSLEEFAASAEFPGPVFDVITSNHVVEHHEDPVSLLRLMASMLKPNGYVWFSVPNIQSRTARTLNEKWHAVDVPYHLMQFSPESASLAVRNAGMNLRTLYTTSLPGATMASLYDIWRFKYFIPRTLTQNLPFLRKLGAPYSRSMDKENEGEAIIVEAVN